MKKVILTIIAIVMIVAMLASCASTATFDENSPIAGATLAGPTGMGMVQMLDNPAYEIGVYSAPDQITPKIISGEVSMATVPSNLAAVLYNKMDGAIKVVAVNTMGVLYILESGKTVTDLSDLSGKTIYATGQGATPEYVLNEVLAANGLDDVTVIYMGAHADLANAMAAGEVTLALVPEPFVSIVLAKNPDVQVKIDVNAEWKAIYGTDIPMGVTVVSTELAANKAAMDKIIADYSSSVNFVTANIGDASQAIEDSGIIAAAAIARAAIPRCAISFITGQDAKAMLQDYFNIMYGVAPASIGGALPGDDFYYIP